MLPADVPACWASMLPADVPACWTSISVPCYWAFPIYGALPGAPSSRKSPICVVYAGDEPKPTSRSSSLGTPPRYGALPGAPSSRACVPRASPICACAGEEQNQPQFTVLGLVAPVEMKPRLAFELPFAVIGQVASAEFGFAFEPPLAVIGQVASAEFGARVDLQHEDSADIPLAELSAGPLPCTSPHSKREAALRPAFESAHADRPCSPAICQWRRSLPTYPRMTMQEGALNQPRLPMLMQERAFYYHHERPHRPQSHSGVSSVSPGLPASISPGRTSVGKSVEL